MTVDRRVVARSGTVALAEPAPGDRDRLEAGMDGLFDLDPDPRELPATSVSGHLSVLELGPGDTAQLLGDVSWHAVLYGPSRSCAAWNFGIALLPSARGRGVGSVAQRLLVEHLFSTTDLDRIEASTDVDNHAEQRALEKAGLRREGVLRGAQLRGGQRRDIVLYGVIRTDLHWS